MNLRWRIALVVATAIALSCLNAGAAAPAGETHASPAQEVAHETGVHEKAEMPELPSFVTVLLHTHIGGTPIKDTAFGHFLHAYEKQIVLVVVTAIMAVFIFGTLRLRALKPGKLQTLLEMLVEGFYSFILGILGERGRPYVPFLGTLFLFILVNNLMGIVPLMAPATSKFQTTVTLAVIAFAYVHIIGIQLNGVFRWMDHLAGSPRTFIDFLMIPLHLIGELARPISLSLRLFGNIMGEDILIGVFLMLGIMMVGAVWHNPWIGVPLHFPFFFLALITSTIQALVFTVLTTIYLFLLLPHEAHKEGEHKHA
jgi:F-type H+-transporting ATPase subunit a